VRELTTVMTRKGQITVPAEVRRLLGLKEGDRVAVVIEDGEEPGEPRVALRPARSVAERTFGIFATGGPPVDFAELRRRFEEDYGAEVATEGLPDR
jgi:AbrB family looped-hinge helix DNA binding protein